MGKKVDIKVGDKFERLEVVEIIPGVNIKVRCICNPDRIYEIGRSGLLSRMVKSCGCKKKEHLLSMITTHGYTKTKLYAIYRCMVKRCFDETHISYHNYGGRGITICQDWNPRFLDYTEAFLNFKYWAERNSYSENLTLDRIDNDNNYCPNNCCFTSLQEQLHKKRTTVYLTYNGIKKNITQWSKDPICKVSYKVLNTRVNKEWPAERALTLPASLNNSKYKKI